MMDMRKARWTYNWEKTQCQSVHRRKENGTERTLDDRYGCEAASVTIRTASDTPRQMYKRTDTIESAAPTKRQ